MKLQFYFVLVLIWSDARGSDFCAKRFSELSPLRTTRPSDPTDNLINYLQILLDQTILKHADLSKIADAIDKGKFVNPLSQETGSVDSTVLLHWEELQQYESQNLNLEKLRAWVNLKLTETSSVSVARETIADETSDAVIGAVFHTVMPGSFQRTLYLPRTTIPQKFKMMATHVTRQQWLDFMGSDPFVILKKRKTAAQNETPVRNITWWSAAEFANRLSVQAGLKPVYDFSELKFNPRTKVENGTLSVESGRVKVNSPNENVYETEGYRLPTMEELAYVLYLASFYQVQLSGKSPNFEKHTWSSNNSRSRPHRVGSRLPFNVDKSQFYDLLGNVAQWVHRIEHLNFFGAEVGQFGGSYNTQYSIKGSFLYERPSTRSDEIGFRLVRTVK